MYIGGLKEHASMEKRMLQIEQFVAQASILDEMITRKRKVNKAQRQLMDRQIDIAFNEFLANMLSVTGNATEEKLAPALSRRYELSVSDFSDLHMVAVPLAIVRELVARHRVIIKSSTHPNWKLFAQRYKAAIHA